MFDIDCHIIIHKEPQWKIDRCLASLEGQPVNLHLVEGKEEYPPCAGRAKGFAMGSAPYITYIDPDDWVEPGAFALLNENLGVDLLFGKERVWNRGSVLAEQGSVHHLFVLKRGFGFDPTCGPKFAFNPCKDKKFLDVVLYNWDLDGGRYGR